MTVTDLIMGTYSMLRNMQVYFIDCINIEIRDLKIFGLLSLTNSTENNQDHQLELELVSTFGQIQKSLFPFYSNKLIRDLKRSFLR